MAQQNQYRRGSTALHSVFTGAVGEITVDTDKNTLVVHDGVTVGGHPLPKERKILTEAERDAITSWAADDEIYNTTINRRQYYDGTTWVTY